MAILAWAALLLGGAAVLRHAAGLVALARYSRRARLHRLPKGPTPPLSLIKPLYGVDPGLAENLVATLRQNYPDFEVIFVHERPDDPALEAVAAARAAVPDVPVTVLAGRDGDAANPKVAVLLRGEAAARHDLIAAADSDVAPDPLYLRDIANGLREADAVSFVPVMFGMETPSARLAGLLINADAVPTLLLGGGRAMTGATIGVRRDALERIGGWRAVADRIADDHALGVALRRAGCTLALAQRPARLRVPGEAVGATARWALRWARTVRSAAPGLYFGVLLPLALAPPALLLALATPWHAPALALLAAHTVLRATAAVWVDARFGRDQATLRALPLLPLLWLLEPLAALAGAAGSTVVWRGRRYRLKGGRATLLHA